MDVETQFLSLGKQWYYERRFQRLDRSLERRRMYQRIRNSTGGSQRSPEEVLTTGMIPVLVVVPTLLLGIVLGQLYWERLSFSPWARNGEAAAAPAASSAGGYSASAAEVEALYLPEESVTSPVCTQAQPRSVQPAGSTSWTAGNQLQLVSQPPCSKGTLSPLLLPSSLQDSFPNRK